MTGHTATLSLLEAFFSCCERAFRFMEMEHNFSYISGVLKHRKGRRIIKPAEFHEIPGQRTHAITLYKNGPTDLDISYLPAHGLVEITISQNGVERINLLQLMAAAQRSIHDTLHNPSFLHERTLDEFLFHAGQLVKNNMDCILEPPPALLQRALLAQEKLTEQKIRLRFQNDLEEASQDAARAFLKKDYRRVIEILRPYEAYLSQPDKKKLARAKREILKD